MQQGLDLLARGRRAGKAGVMAELIKADIDFHQFLYQASGNPMIAETTALALATHPARHGCNSAQRCAHPQHGVG